MIFKYRNDIDGLRALAIIFVVIYHGFPDHLSGGFTGVDIFFVISGFLITKIIISSLNNNNFDLLDFYKKRINRIFPSLILMMALSLSIGSLVLYPEELKKLVEHLIYAGFFVSNFSLWIESGYFDAASETKPLLNLWSLAVEEQFYLIWPGIILLLQRLNLLNIKSIIFLIAISFLLYIFTLNKDSSAAFYFPYTRFWELWIGSALTLISINENKNKPLISNILSLTGLLLIIAGVLFIEKRENFLNPLSFAPVLGTALIIYSGDNAWVNSKILSNKILMTIGLISYPLYLLHWPLLSFGYIYEGQAPSIKFRCMAILVAIGFSYITYRYIETPIRSYKFKKSPTILLFCMVAFILISAFIYTAIPSSPKSYTTNQEHGWNNTQISDECIKKYAGHIPKTEFCRNNDNGDPTILLMGDSMAFQLFFGLVNVTKPNENVLSLNQGNCPTFLSVSSREDFKVCEEVSKKSLELVLSSNTIHTIILSGAPIKYSKDIHPINIGLNAKHVNKFNSFSEYETFATNSLRNLIEALIKKNIRIIFVPFNPQLPFDIKSCLNPRPFKAMVGCSQPKSQHLSNGLEYKDIVYSTLKDYPEVVIFDMDKIFCDENNCFGIANGGSLYRDHWHLSSLGSTLVSTKLVEYINQKN